MTRILQLVTRDEPGGIQVLTGMVQTGLRQRGLEVTTLALHDGGTRRARAIHLWATAKALLGGKYDAVLSYQAAAGFMGAVLGRAGGIPFRAVHQTALPSAVRPHWRLLDRWCGRLGFHTHIIANSAATEAAYAHYPPAYRQKLLRIVHGVTPLPTPKLAFNWRGALFIQPSAPLLVTTGRLAAQKNHRLSIAALAKLPTAHLIIAGEGPDRDMLNGYARDLGVLDRLHLIGDRPRQTIASLLAAADLYVFPSIWETFGLAVVEAGMAGLPIVAADLPVLREVLQPASQLGMARFHPSTDAVALATAIRAALADRPNAATRLASARAMSERHGIGPMLDSYEGLLDGVRRRSR